MKIYITNSVETEETTFENIYAGDFYLYEDILYMKVDDYNRGCNCVNIGSGETGWIDDDEIISLVKDLRLTV